MYTKRLAIELLSNHGTTPSSKDEKLRSKRADSLRFNGSLRVPIALQLSVHPILVFLPDSLPSGLPLYRKGCAIARPNGGDLKAKLFFCSDFSDAARAHRAGFLLW